MGGWRKPSRMKEPFRICLLPLVLVLLLVRPAVGINRLELRDRAKAMFTFAYDGYMKYAFPADELDPIHCAGRSADPNLENINVNDALGNYSLSLIDTLDTLALMGNKTEFWKAAQRVFQEVSFDQDHIVQIFEANIRVLGGLLSAHLVATDPHFKMSNEFYDNEFLYLAKDLATRFLPAFQESPTGLPYPRVNLRTGVPAGWRTDNCPAGVGTLLLEFVTLSRLLDDPIFEDVARTALKALWQLRDRTTGLIGGSFDVNTGELISNMTGPGAGFDSFYEYLFKAYVLSGEQEYLHLFNEMYHSLNLHARAVNMPGLYFNVDAHTRFIRNQWIDSLGAFLPGLQAVSGDPYGALYGHLMYKTLWETFGAIPERFDFSVKQPTVNFYPLRPEFVESTYLLYRATRDPTFLRVGEMILDDIEWFCKAKCGYATIHDVTDKTQEDRMESFFLSETCKYLYLLFDEENPLHRESLNSYVLTTQGHILYLPHHLRVDRFSQPEHSTRIAPLASLPHATMMKSCPALTWEYYIYGPYPEALRAQVRSFIRQPPRPPSPPSPVVIASPPPITFTFLRSPASEDDDSGDDDNDEFDDDELEDGETTQLHEDMADNREQNQEHEETLAPGNDYDASSATESTDTHDREAASLSSSRPQPEIRSTPSHSSSATVASKTAPPTPTPPPSPPVTRSTTTTATGKPGTARKSKQKKKSPGFLPPIISSLSGNITELVVQSIRTAIEAAANRTKVAPPK